MPVRVTPPTSGAKQSDTGPSRSGPVRVSPMPGGRTPRDFERTGGGGIVGRFAEGAGRFAVDLPVSLAKLGEAAAKDTAGSLTLGKYGTKTGESAVADIALNVARSYADRYKPLAKGDIGEFAHRVNQDPFGYTLDLFGTAGVGTKAGSTAKIARSVRKANPNVGRARAVALARKESRAPGYLAARDDRIEGGIKPRTLKSEIPGGGTREVMLPQARSPLGRGAQRAGDTVSRKLPAGAPLSERRRANREIARELEQQETRNRARAANLFEPVRKVAFKGSPTRRDRNQALVAYALQTPKNAADPFHGPRAVADAIDEMLATGQTRHTINPTPLPDKKILPGRKVRPLDRKNVGTVVSVDESARTARVYFHNRQTNARATVEFSFDELASGKLLQPRPLTAADRTRLQSESTKIRKALDDPPDPAEFEAAVAAMEDVSREAETMGRHIAGRSPAAKQPAVAERLDKVFKDRRNLLSSYLGIEGDARGFFPHRQQSSVPAAVRGTIRGSGDVIGRPQPKGISMKKNELRLFESGRASTDPRVLQSAHEGRQRFMEAEKARRNLFAEAAPLDKAPLKPGYLIRDPDVPPKSLTSDQRLLANPKEARRQAVAAIDAGEDVNTVIGSWQDQWLRPFRPGDKPVPDDWADAPDSVRWVPRDVVEKRLPRRVSVDPNAKALPVLGTANAIARVGLIHGKPARYVATNTVQNIVNGTITNPTAVVRGIRNQGALARSVPAVDKMWRALKLPDGLRARRPDLYRLVAAEAGDVLATALPELRTAANRTQKVESVVQAGTRKLGQALGEAADTPYRVAVWQQRARRYGFKTDDQIERLLTSDEPAIQRVRKQVMQGVRDDMYDFNRLSPKERDGIARFVFLWPLVRAGVRYPATYARDYPIRVGAAGAITQDEGQATGRDRFKYPVGDDKEIPTAWAMPHDLSMGMLEDINAAIHGNFGGAAYRTSPPLAAALDQAFGPPWKRGWGQAAHDVAQLTPGVGPALDIKREGVRGIPVVKRFTPQPKKKR